MPETPDWQKDRVRAYYRAVTERHFLQQWSGNTLAIHFGLSDDSVATHEESLLATNQELARRAGIVSGMRVCDAGCGVGGTAIWIAREIGAHVTGISLEPSQVELATKFALEANVAGRTSFACMDFAHTSFAEGSFDVLYNLESLCHAADTTAYLRHVHGLLADGGRFACIDVFRGTGGDAGQTDDMCRGWHLPDLQTREGVAALLRENGFAEVEEVDLTERVRRSAATLRPIASRGLISLQAQNALVTHDGQMRAGNAIGALGAIDGFLSGAVTYGFVSGRKR